MKISFYTIFIAELLFGCSNKEEEPNCALNNSKVTTPDYNFCVDNVDANFQVNSSTGLKQIYLTIQELDDDNSNVKVREYKMIISYQGEFPAALDGTLTELAAQGVGFHIEYSINSAITLQIVDNNEFRLNVALDKSSKKVTVNATGEMFSYVGSDKTNQGTWLFVINDITHL